MFREMRRKGQQISAKECAEILSNAKSGVLGLHGDDGYHHAARLQKLAELVAYHIEIAAFVFEVLNASVIDDGVRGFRRELSISGNKRHNILFIGR